MLISKKYDFELNSNLQLIDFNVLDWQYVNEGAASIIVRYQPFEKENENLVKNFLYKNI